MTSTLAGRRPRGRPPRDPNAPPKPPSQRDAAIVTQYQAGETLLAIARKHGLSHQRIHQIMKRAGIPLQNLNKRRAPTLRPRLCASERRSYMPCSTALAPDASTPLSAATSSDRGVHMDQRHRLCSNSPS
jgi:hypothetical protein